MKVDDEMKKAVGVVERRQAFFQHRRGMSPILMEVVRVEQRLEAMDICKVRWHIMEKNKVSTLVFSMAARNGHFADFVSIPRAIFVRSLQIIKDLKQTIVERERLEGTLPEPERERLFRNARRRILRLCKLDL